MPIDTQAPLRATDQLLPEPNAVQSSLRDFLSLQQMRGQSEEQQRQRAITKQKQEQESKDLQEQKDADSILDASHGDWDAGIAAVKQKYPLRGLQLEQKFQQARTSALTAHTQEVEEKLKRIRAGLSIMNGVEDDGDYQVRMPALRQISPEVADLLGPTYDPKKVDHIRQIGLSAEQLYNERRGALQDFADGKSDTGLLRYLKTASNEDEYQQILQGARSLGIPAGVLAMYPQHWTPDTPKKLEEMGLTAYQKGMLKDKADDNARMLANQQAAQTQRDRMYQIAKDREASLEKQRGTGGSGAGITANQRESSRRAAEAWRSDHLDKLRDAARGKFDQYGTMIVAPLTDEQIQKEQDAIEASYQAMLPVGASMVPTPEKAKVQGPKVPTHPLVGQDINLPNEGGRPSEPRTPAAPAAPKPVQSVQWKGTSLRAGSILNHPQYGKVTITAVYPDHLDATLPNGSKLTIDISKK